ncbi:hypothetical protein FRC91_13155 [Bradymonadales bacterium TMQ1]|uniref:Uncharacterized protein n=1 Tax=Lujinxingia sediminis TaxID=2480984 RepID=A0ABY0CUU0_9DELT|nr:hypothetical protein [Lujinxingia sediminis]RVU45831.1 hypothetical protein EA187_08720 [Lujinxingia sediminis]TXC75037.1 hypothetical protein FRC91_13155 [Bradymonadales bacterium TMQ1]
MPGVRPSRRHGLELEEETATYPAVAGWTWTWTEINGADGERIKGGSAEDDGYTRIDGIARIMEGNEALTMRTSSCGGF